MQILDPRGEFYLSHEAAQDQVRCAWSQNTQHKNMFMCPLSKPNVAVRVRRSVVQIDCKNPRVDVVVPVAPT